MGLLGALTSIAGGASPEHHGVADVLSQVMQEHPGGMDGILNQLKQNGLGEQVQSWVSPGENKSISPGFRLIRCRQHRPARGYLSTSSNLHHRGGPSSRGVAFFGQ
jgi:YidB-like protein